MTIISFATKVQNLYGGIGKNCTKGLVTSLNIVLEGAPQVVTEMNGSSNFYRRRSHNELINLMDYLLLFAQLVNYDPT